MVEQYVSARVGFFEIQAQSCILFWFRLTKVNEASSKQHRPHARGQLVCTSSFLHCVFRRSSLPFLSTHLHVCLSSPSMRKLSLLTQVMTSLVGELDWDGLMLGLCDGIAKGDVDGALLGKIEG